MMGLIYSKGDIVFVKNVTFKDKDGERRLDLRINGHPFIVLNEINELGEATFALKMTSRRLESVNQREIKLKTNAYNMMKKNSFVNLDKVYLFEINKVIVPVVNIKEQTVNSIMKQINWQKIIR